MAKKKKDNFKEVVDKLWPKTKKELESAICNAKKFMVKSEKYLKSVSEKGVKETKKLSLGLKKEKIFYDLGKAVVKTAPARWKTDKKISDLLKEAKDIDCKIKKVK